MPQNLKYAAYYLIGSTIFFTIMVVVGGVILNDASRYVARGGNFDQCLIHGTHC